MVICIPGISSMYTCMHAFMSSKHAVTPISNVTRNITLKIQLKFCGASKRP